MKKLFLSLLMVPLFNGCTVTNVASKAADGASTQVKAYTIAYPWLDTTKSINKATLSSTTNKANISLTGYTEAETTSTNFANIAGTIASAVTSAAVKAAVSTVKP